MQLGELEGVWALSRVHIRREAMCIVTYDLEPSSRWAYQCCECHAVTLQGAGGPADY